MGPCPYTPYAFAIVAYDRTGFWIQNSWGEEWGLGGFFHIARGRNECGIETLGVAGVPIDYD